MSVGFFILLFSCLGGLLDDETILHQLNQERKPFWNYFLLTLTSSALSLTGSLAIVTVPLF
jgi:hypothetical protein